MTKKLDGNSAGTTRPLAALRWPPGRIGERIATHLPCVGGIHAAAAASGKLAANGLRRDAQGQPAFSAIVFSPGGWWKVPVYGERLIAGVSWSDARVLPGRYHLSIIHNGSSGFIMGR